MIKKLFNIISLSITYFLRIDRILLDNKLNDLIRYF